MALKLSKNKGFVLHKVISVALIVLFIGQPLYAKKKKKSLIGSLANDIVTDMAVDYIKKDIARGKDSHILKMGSALLHKGNEWLHKNESAKEINQQGTTSCSKYRVMATQLNVRSAPGGNIIGTIEENAVVCVYEYSGEWARTDYGWLSSQYLMSAGDEPTPAAGTTSSTPAYCQSSLESFNANYSVFADNINNNAYSKDAFEENYSQLKQQGKKLIDECNNVLTMEDGEHIASYINRLLETNFSASSSKSSLSSAEPENHYSTQENASAIDQVKLQSFLDNFYRSGNSDDISESLAFYSYPLENYFGKFNMNEDAIYKDKRRYYKRWPIRSYQLTDYKITNDEYRNGTRYLTVVTSFHWMVSSSKKTLSGSGKSLMKIKVSGADFHIVSISEYLEK
jgi:hypothetical protein